MSLRMIKDVLRPRDIATHCPLCGREAAKAPHTEEHIIPLWLQQKHGLLNRQLTIPNFIGKRYKSVKIGICERCNNRTFGGLETRMAPIFNSDNPFEGLAKVDPEDIAVWLGKIMWLLARKSHSAEDFRTRNKAKPERILRDELLPGFLYLGMFLRCFARGKAMFSCYRGDPPFPDFFYSAPYSLYLYEIDTRDDRFEQFDFIDNSVSVSVALRSGNVGIVCLFDGGLHRDFRSGEYAYLAGERLHPVQFSELAARLIYDQTVLDPDATQVTYYSNRPLNAIVSQTMTPRHFHPYREELHDPARLARTIGFYTHNDPEQILFENGATFTTLRKYDGTFLPFPVTEGELEEARKDPALLFRVPDGTARDKIIASLLEDDDKGPDAPS